MFGLFRRGGGRAVRERALEEAVEAVQFRQRLDDFLAANGVTVWSQAGLASKVAAVVGSMVAQAALKSGERFDPLSPAARERLALVVVIATDHISAQARVPFEPTALEAGLGMLYDSTDDEDGIQLLERAGARYNHLAGESTRKHLVTDVGQAVAKWFATTNPRWLGELSAGYERLTVAIE